MSLSFPTSPAVGQVYQNWVWSGSSWDPLAGAQAGKYQVSIYLAAGAATFTTPSDSSTATIYRVRAVAGGGGAGGGTSGGAYYPGAGGGGEAVEGVLTGLPASTAVALTIGAGGLGGQGNSGLSQAGGNTTLSVGALTLTLHGGGGGDYARTSAGTGLPGGLGGHGGSYVTQTNWQLIRSCPGQDGQTGMTQQNWCPDGGASLLGFGGKGFSPTGPTSATPGIGGGGAPVGPMAVSNIGTPGGAGAVIIERIAG